VSERAAFASILAQAIPVVVLAVMAESRARHQARISAAAAAAAATTAAAVTPAAPAQPAPASTTDNGIASGFIQEAVVLTFLVWLEVAALLTANDEAGGPCIAWFAGNPSVIGVGVLFVVTGRYYVLSVSKSYEIAGLTLSQHQRRLEIFMEIWMWVAVAAAIALVCAYWPPWAESACR
jgi:hypothetical protein